VDINVDDHDRIHVYQFHGFVLVVCFGSSPSFVVVVVAPAQGRIRIPPRIWPASALMCPTNRWPATLAAHGLAHCARGPAKQKADANAGLPITIPQRGVC
jgi:hypothetical protein